MADMVSSFHDRSVQISARDDGGVQRLFCPIIVVYLRKRARRASAVACDVARSGAVLPTTRNPSTKQTRILAALEGSTPSANLPAVCARESASATRISMALKKP